MDSYWAVHGSISKRRHRWDGTPLSLRAYQNGRVCGCINDLQKSRLCFQSFCKGMLVQDQSLQYHQNQASLNFS